MQISEDVVQSAQRALAGEPMPTPASELVAEKLRARLAYAQTLLAEGRALRLQMARLEEDFAANRAAAQQLAELLHELLKAT